MGVSEDVPGREGVVPTGSLWRGARFASGADREMARILGLPARLGFETTAAAAVLRPAQVAALAAWAHALVSMTSYGPPGLAVLAGVGHGKTLVGLLLPTVAAHVTGRAPRTLYLVPAAIRAQWAADRAMWAARPADDVRSCVIPADEFVIMSHEGLSAPSGRDFLRDYAPELIVIDEAHAYADPKSGRWRRIAEYLALRPTTRVVVMSGSLSWRSVLQARHLLLAALRGWCPLPVDDTIDAWARVLDVDADFGRDDAIAVAPLVQAFTASSYDTAANPGAFRAAARAAYRRRLETCPGVVLTESSGVDVGLRLVAWRPSVAPSAEITAAVKGLEDAWVLPDGTELVGALDFARHAATLPLGCYTRWVPGTADPRWVEARRTWARYLRSLVEYGGYQTPGAAAAAAEAGDLDGTAAGSAYLAWAAAEDAYDAPRTETVWLDGGDYTRRVVAEYADGGTTAAGGPTLADAPIVWTRTPAIGEAIAAAMGWAYYGAGSRPPTDGPAVVSYLVHGTGWSGAPAAGYRHALIVEPPSSGATWEQVLGRLHRAGATDDVTVHVLCASSAGYRAIAKGVADATYVHETTGAAQKILDADWVGYRVPRGPGEGA